MENKVNVRFLGRDKMLLKTELKMNLWKAEYIVILLYVSPLCVLRKISFFLYVSACTAIRIMLE